MATQQIITKKLSETVRVSVDVSNMQPASYVGFRVVYPAGILAPVGTGAGNAVQYEDGDVFAGMDVDTIANNQIVDGTFFVYVSKALKDQSSVMAAYDNRVITLLFQAVGFGVGDIQITERKYGKVIGEVPTDYNSTADDLALTLQEEVVAHFTIEVV